jgi:hypothetical protein
MSTNSGNAACYLTTSVTSMKYGSLSQKEQTCYLKQQSPVQGLRCLWGEHSAGIE